MVLRNFAPNVVIAILQFHMWTYKLALKFRAKLRGDLLPMMLWRKSQDESDFWDDELVVTAYKLRPSATRLFQIVFLYGKDSNVTAMMNKVDLAIIPVLNVDGYAYSWTKVRFARH